ncbi:sterol O-acyltransferase 1-like isoform X2 [Dreissena polymorpha]|uniref:sterol O-acyltransferase 1-like isoform X2 n=1 Tax=Dreissena polymorpha TaxID=45954 RepID=UPI00226435AC|nr:sterol O-acyltransferase 1-like isoform X2 [Dreissena polymorpha]
MEHAQENGISHRNRAGLGENENGASGDNRLEEQIKIQRLLNEAQRFRDECTEKVKRDIEEYFDAFISDVGLINQAENVENIKYSLNSSNLCTNIYKENTDYLLKKERGELPDKEFVTRHSVLTDLFEISHIRSIYHVFVAILIIFSLNTFIMDILEKGSLGLDFGLIQWGLGKFPRVVSCWLWMQLSTLIVVYPGFYYWSVYRSYGKPGILDYLGLLAYIAYQCAFMVLPVLFIVEHEIPPASAVIITTEQLRFMMKSHAFVRENFPKVLAFKKEDNKDHDRSDLCPNFSKYLYFLFAPTLVYRDNYPRTASIRWGYVVSNFAQVVACLLYTYYIFERFCVPVFRNFNQDHVSANLFLKSMFSCMLPGTLTLLIGFFAILHSWLNAFAEMLTFADRMFYKDWWNMTSFASYYRTWNIVVHDWLYTYVYRDCCKVFGPKYRGLSMASVFLLSAVFHEYVLIMALGFFYPVLFVLFMGAGFGLIFVKGSYRLWNIFLWLALFMGMGVLLCLYNMEWFARQNCPKNSDDFMDYLIPRSWTCNFNALKSSTQT